MTINDNLIKTLNEQLNNLLMEKETILVSIDGPAASGKTTLASLLNGYVFHIDDFFLENQDKYNHDIIGSNIDKEKIINILTKIKTKNESFVYKTFDCKTKTYLDKRYTQTNIIIVEGVYSNLDCFKDFFDYKIFCTVNTEEQESRLKTRRNYTDFKNIWLVKETKYFKEINPIKNADYIIKDEV